MANQVVYDSTIYKPKHLWDLVDALTACGWEIWICAKENRRAPGTPPGRNAYRCECTSRGWEVWSSQTFGSTPWGALANAVDKVILPAERNS